MSENNELTPEEIETNKEGLLELIEIIGALIKSLDNKRELLASIHEQAPHEPPLVVSFIQDMLKGYVAIHQLYVHNANVYKDSLKMLQLLKDNTSPDVFSEFINKRSHI
jgi:hypothetical protein